MLSVSTSAASVSSNCMKLLLSLLLLGICVLSAFAQIPKIEPGVSHDLAVWRSAHYSDVRYKLNLTLEKMSPVLRGTIEIRVTVTEPESIPPAVDSSQFADQTTHSIILDWRKLAGHEKDSAISNATINGTALVLWSTYKSPVGKNYPTMHYREIFPNYREVGKYLIFRDGVVPGENVIKLDFTSPILTSGSAITRYIDKEDGSEYIYSLLSPSNASSAFPMFNQPDLKARFSASIVVPGDWSVVSNTPASNVHHTEDYKQTGETKDSTGTTTSVTFDKSWIQIWSFEETKPISPHAFTLAAGPFKSFGFQSQSESPGSSDQFATSKNLRMTVYIRASQPAKSQSTSVNKLLLSVADKYFDFKSEWPQYDLVLIPDLPSEMVQAAGIAFVRESSIIHEK
jgi:aminopeptidase N